MLRRTFVTIAAAIGICLAAPACTSTAPDGQDTPINVEGQYAPVNGLNLYYEIHGSGKPLILIHGGLGTIESLFGALLPELAKTRQVIAVELQGHGHTADIDRPLRYEFMADDIAALIKHLGHETADIFGFSLGGGVALRVGIQHPDVVSKLVVASAPAKFEGWYPEARAGMAAVDADAMLGTVLHEAYLDAAPRPEDWPVLIDKIRTLITEDYDWTSSLGSIKAPTLIMIGDADGVVPAHAMEMFGLLGGGKPVGWVNEAPVSQLAVLPGTTHFDILYRTDLLLPVVVPFLDRADPE